MHICREEVVALIHFVDSTLKVTAVSINNESILDIIAVVLWLPYSVECNSIELINRTSLTWSHLVTAVRCFPLNNSVTIWISIIRWRGYL